MGFKGVFCTTVIACGLIAPQASATAPTDPLRNQQWYLDMIRSPGSSGPDAAGTLVAVLDSGVDVRHPDLQATVHAGPDFSAGTPGIDLNGHGTNVAGIIAAQPRNDIGIEGAAPGAAVLSIRVLDAQGQGDTSQVAKGIDAAVAAGAKVINLSLNAGPQQATTVESTDPVIPAMQRAVAAGVVIVAAAGNFALPLCAQPMAVTGILCVGAVDRASRLAQYSNFGLRVNVVAPGGDATNSIISTAPGGRYGAMFGTSQATPQASALAARLVAQGLTAQEAIRRIEETARDVGAPGEDPIYGHGLIDMSAATGIPVPASSAAPSAPSTPQQGHTQSASITVTIPSPIPRNRLLSHGIIVACRTTARGTCRVEIRRRGLLLAGGARRTRPDTQTNIRLRATKQGRRMLRRHPRLRVSIAARGPAGSTASTTALISASS
jgi:subtilisin family serine protease